MTSSRAWLFAVVMAGCSSGEVTVPDRTTTQVGSDGGMTAATMPDLGDGGVAGSGTDLAGDPHAPLPTPSGPEQGAYASFSAQVASAACKRAVRCGVVAAGDEAQCEATELATITTPPPYSVDDAIAAARASLDATAAQGCLGAIGNAGCGAADNAAVDVACSGVVGGTVANGSGCRADVDCADGFCATVALGCGGICKAFVSAGFSCANAVCDDSSSCDATSNVCVARGASGSPCSDTQPCGGGLVCLGFVSGSGASGKCGAVVKSGGTCASSAECDAGLWCDAGTSKCTALVAANSSCTAFDACQAGLGCVGLTMPNGASVGSAGTCKAWLDVGAACDSTADETGCAQDAPCSAGNKCQAAGAVGMACTSSSGCRQGLYCNVAGACAQPVPYGGACDPGESSASQCLAGACDATARACLTYCS